jgi:hypothetical protein
MWLSGPTERTQKVNSGSQRYGQKQSFQEFHRFRDSPINEIVARLTGSVTQTYVAAGHEDSVTEARCG